VARRFPLTLLCAFVVFVAGCQMATYLSGEANQPDWVFPLLSAGLLAGWYALVPELPGLVWSLRLAVLLPGIAVAVRRMHDVGKSGWFILVAFYHIVLAATEGDRVPNEYGPDPKSGSIVAPTSF